MKDRALILKLCYKNGDSVALQKFRTHKAMRKGIGPMTIMILVKMMKKLKNTGSVDVPPGRGKKICDSSLLEEIASAVQEKSSGGVQP